MAEKLEEFNWEEETTFFETEKPEEKEVEVEEIEEDPEKPEEAKETFFSEEETQEEVTELNFKSLYSNLKESGVFKHVEIPEDEEVDEDKFLELQAEEIEAEVGTRLEAWAQNELDEDAQAFIKFKLKGGSTQEFFDTYGNSVELDLSGDISDEDFQDDIIRQQLTSDGWDRDEIEDRLEFLTSNNKKQKTAERYLERLQEEDKQRKVQLTKQLEERDKQVKRNEEAYKDTIKEVLSSTTEINGFKITDKDKIDVLNFLTKKSIKSGDKEVTGFQAKLSEVFKDPKKTVLLAKLVANDFDISQLEKEIKTKEAKRVKDKIKQGSTTSSFGSSRGRSLADLFEN